MSTTIPKVRGRQFFANPGPTNIPDSVLRAMDRPSIDFNDPEFAEVYDAAFAGVKRVLRTTQHLFMYNASGHGAWEASLTNLLSPGDTIVVLESGYFSDEWAAMARSHGLEVTWSRRTGAGALTWLTCGRFWRRIRHTPSRRCVSCTMRLRPE